MKIEQIAVQLYTLRDFTETPADFAATMKRVREIGYPPSSLLELPGCPQPRLQKSFTMPDYKSVPATSRRK